MVTVLVALMAHVKFANYEDSGLLHNTTSCILYTIIPNIDAQDCKFIPLINLPEGMSSNKVLKNPQHMVVRVCASGLTLSCVCFRKAD